VHLLEHLQYSDVRGAPRAAAGKHETDARSMVTVE
jgi:hypothetical protein